MVTSAIQRWLTVDMGGGKGGDRHVAPAYTIALSTLALASQQEFNLTMLVTGVYSHSVMVTSAIQRWLTVDMGGGKGGDRHVAPAYTIALSTLALASQQEFNLTMLVTGVLRNPEADNMSEEDDIPERVQLAGINTEDCPGAAHYGNHMDYLRLLLLRAGDIEQNPGPITVCPCKVEKGGFTIVCHLCKQNWHLECVGLEGLTEAPLRKIKTWTCDLCRERPAEITVELINKLCPDTAKIMKQMNDMEARLNAKIENIAAIGNGTGNGFSDAVRRNMESKVNNTNRIVQNIVRQKDPNTVIQEKKEKDNRTLIVKKYMNKNIKDSKDIWRIMNKEYPGEIMRNVRTTAGGSILLELDDNETLERVRRKWKKTTFGGNNGVVMIKGNPPAGLIKNVFVNDDDDDDEEEITEDDIKAEIIKTFPDIEVDFFHNKDDEFSVQSN